MNFKYRNKPTHSFWRGEPVRFASKAEARRGAELELLERVKEITGLQRQVKFVVTLGSEKVRYIADFVYFEGTKMVAEDVKGFETEEWKVKWAVMKGSLPDIEWRVVK